MTEESDIFETLVRTSSVVEDATRHSLMTRRTDYKLRQYLNRLYSFLTEINIAAKIACVQWALTALKKDDAKGLPVYFCLSELLRRGSRQGVTLEHYLILARDGHPLADGRDTQQDTQEIRQNREKARRKRIKENLESCRKTRDQYVDLMGNPLPSDLFMRTSLFNGMSDKEVLAAFLACVAGQDTNWMAEAMAHAQNARSEVMESKDQYNAALHLANIYIKALQLNLRSRTSTSLDEAPVKKPAFMSNKVARKTEGPSAVRSANKPPVY